MIRKQPKRNKCHFSMLITLKKKQANTDNDCFPWMDIIQEYFSLLHKSLHFPTKDGFPLVIPQ